MNRMKTFLKYLIAIVLLYFISNFLISYFLESNYKSLESSKIETENYDITIKEAKATNANGQLSGQINKKEDASESNEFLKVDFYNKRDNLLGTKYIDVSNLHSGESKDFNVDFNYQDVSKYVVTTVEEMPNKLVEISKSEYFGLAVLGALIVLSSVM